MAFLVVLVVHLQQGAVVQEQRGQVVAVAEVFAELPAGPVVHQQLEMVAAVVVPAAVVAALLVADIFPQEYPSL